MLMPRILIVEDDIPTQFLLSNTLKKAGYDTVSVDDGTGALKVLASDAHFDLIISDIKMPKMDGFHLLDELKASYPHIPIVIFSVHTDLSIIDQVTKRGASFLPKPFTLKQLKNAVYAAAI